jgi:hypothetical protein
MTTTKLKVAVLLLAVAAGSLACHRPTAGPTKDAGGRLPVSPTFEPPKIIHEAAGDEGPPARTDGDGNSRPVGADGGGLRTAEAAALQDRLLEAAKTNKPLTITPKVGVGPVKFGMSAAEVESALGEPFRTTGRAKEYQHLGLAVVMDERDRVAAILVGAWCEASDILLDVFKGGTEAGVRLRADRGEVVKAHGEPSAVRSVGPPEAEFEVLGYDALRAEFALRKGKLVHVTLKRSADGR